jgi:hypothetical protein
VKQYAAVIVAEKRRYLLRLDAEIHGAIEKWAADDLRSVNAQIEYLLTEALRKAGRLPAKRSPAAQAEEAAGGDETAG